MTAVPSNPAVDSADPTRRLWRWWWLALVIPAALIALALAVFLLFVVFNISGRGARAKLRATHISLATIKNALSQYQLANNAYPPNLQALVTGQYLAPGMLDGWSQPFQYSPMGPSGNQPYVLYSSGPDLMQATHDDISVWNLK